MDFIKMGMTAAEVKYLEDKKAASDEGMRQRLNQYRNRQVVENLKTILPDHIKQEMIRGV